MQHKAALNNKPDFSANIPIFEIISFIGVGFFELRVVINSLWVDDKPHSAGKNINQIAMQGIGREAFFKFYYE